MAKKKKEKLEKYFFIQEDDTAINILEMFAQNPRVLAFANLVIASMFYIFGTYYVFK